MICIVCSILKIRATSVCDFILTAEELLSHMASHGDIDLCQQLRFRLWRHCWLIWNLEGLYKDWQNQIQNLSWYLQHRGPHLEQRQLPCKASWHLDWSMRQVHGQPHGSLCSIGLSLTCLASCARCPSLYDPLQTQSQDCRPPLCNKNSKFKTMIPAERWSIFNFIYLLSQMNSFCNGRIN